MDIERLGGLLPQQASAPDPSTGAGPVTRDVSRREWRRSLVTHSLLRVVAFSVIAISCRDIAVADGLAAAKSVALEAVRAFCLASSGDTRLN
jgi:hypothetical protein